MREWFRAIRKEQKLNQSSFAELLGVDQRTVSLIERGGAISVKTAKRIAEILNIDWTKFFD